MDHRLNPRETDTERVRPRARARIDQHPRAKGGDTSEETMEVEFKLTVPPSANRRLLARLARCGPVTTTLLHAHYHDTADDRLAAAGLSLRLREENGRWRQTLKQSGSGGPGLCRGEHEVELRPADAANPTVDLWLHAGTVPGRALFVALGITADMAKLPTLVKRYSTRVVRRSATVDCGRSRIELAFDQGHIEAGLRSLPLSELEIELKQGDAADLLRLARRWLGEGFYVQAESKAQRGLRLLNGVPIPKPVKARGTMAMGSQAPDGFARSVVAACLAQILPNASVVASGSARDEHVHQLRVGLRRLRTALRELVRLSKDLPVAIEKPLAKVFRQLGMHRDQETVLASIRPRLLAAGARNVAWTEALPGGEVDLAEVVTGGRFQRALLRAMAYAAGPSSDQRASRPRRLKRQLEARLKRLHRRIDQGAQRFTHLPEAEQHDVRKRLKRLRYLSEFAAPLYGVDAVQQTLDALEPAQDALGRHNDGVVALALARQASKHDPDALFAAEWLGKEAERTARRAGRKLLKAGAAVRFWELEEARRERP